MKQYLVGGVVRDRLLGFKATDRDWVIVGAQPHHIEKMLSNGYKQVGNDFPVFLHPKSGEEYALARVERKTGIGYNGFECNANPLVTLEEDLMRRDLTINAIAYDPYTNETFDPYNGAKDLKDKILRHVSPAFSEDPVRVIRTARFAARYNFKVHSSTKKLMKQMAESGEMDALTPERVVAELKKVIKQTATPSIFFKVLKEANAFKILFPNVDDYDLNVLDNAVKNSCVKSAFNIMMAVLLHNCSDATVKNLCTKYKLPASTFSYITDSKNRSSTFIKLPNMQVRDIVTFFDDISLRNKGGEEYVYSLLDVQYAFGKITKNEQEIVMQYYDMYYGTDLSQIDRLCKENGPEWTKTKLKEHIFGLKCDHIAKLHI